MALPKEPRQKMINIMYLVLTALLALNVSSEILNAFRTVNRSLENSTAQVNQSTTTIMQSLEKKTTEGESKERALIWFPKAQQVVATSKTIRDYIASLKGKILTLAGGIAGDPNSKFKEDNLDIVTKLMVKEGEGKKLLQMLKDYRENIFKIDTAIRAEFEKSLNIEIANPPGRDGKIKDWDIAYFNMVPTVAGLTILSKFENDIKTAENKVVTFCHSKVGEVEKVFDAYAPIVGQSAGYLMPGQELVIKAGIGAYNKSSKPIISIGGSGVELGPEGYAEYKTTVNGIGSHTIPVRISYFNQATGKQETLDYPVEYTVASPSGTSVALDEMNVLYIGWQNKVRIAASGAGDDKINVSMSGGGGNISRVAPGQYIATVSQQGDAMINVTVDGKTSSHKFRVRKIPDPVAAVGGIPSNDNIPAGSFKNQPGVGAFIRDFPLDLKYTVTSFTITMDDENGDIREASCQGNLWCPAALSIVRSAAPGRMVTIDNIRAVGPDNINRKVPGLVYYIK